ncbi:MAG: VCBS repeat-containing protein [Lewinellaceae bacterium]|nr:VCBS repeat-containing protein [Phaeodactylibacter sp.]MCB0614268.1 VCBS repeat-containing protein [Phaeodactylibacter sp.]MCB9349094.1 VCBS repeat-containing protein [Lewinellaceae bacterium]
MFKILLFPYFVLAALMVQAQIAPSIDLFEPVGDIQYTLAFDVDNDADFDVICATNERLFWLEQLADGSFSRQHLIATAGISYRSLAYADVDADGDEDLIYAANDAGLGIHLNLGNGEMGPAIELYNPGTVIDCYLADFNADGRLDIVASTSSEVRWLPGNGNGSFAPPRLVSDQHETTTSVHAEDLDGDGDQDILVAAQFSDRLAWHENSGDGIFSDYRLVEGLYDGPSSVITADLDGDGLPDIICANRQEEADTGAGLVWYRNLGGGNFEMVDTLMSRGWHAFVHAVDMDVDGDMDLVSCHGLDEMDWLANDGSGNFSEPIELERYAAYLRFVDTPDLNNDGFPDILYGVNSNSPQKQTVLWRASTGGGALAPPELITMGAYNLSNPEVVDMDQDGLLDVVIGSDGTDALVWLKNEGQQFSQPRLIARRHNYTPKSIAVVDINNDGWPDVLAGSIQDNGTNRSDFCFYIQNGDGAFTATPYFPTYYYPHRDLQMVDMDNDGDLDMLWASPGTNTINLDASVGWVRNDAGVFSVQTLLISGVAEILDVLVTDLDDDGQIELVICKRENPSLGWMEHTGNGNYTALQEIPNNFTGGLYAQAADINGDGLLDLVASNEPAVNGVDRIAWWPNLGNGQLGAQQDIYVGQPPLEKFVIEDFDLDGRKDIVASTYQDYPMQLLRQLEDGTFSDPGPIAGTANKVRNFVLIDMEGDGDWDIVGNGDQPLYPSTNRLFISYNLANDESISGTVFYDLDGNGQQGVDETGIGRIPITVEPAAIAVFADENGQFTVYGASGAYTLSPQLDDCWALTTTPESYEVTFDGTASIDSLRFGVTPNTEAPEAAVTLASAPTRCGFTVPFWLNYRNDGCWAFDGEVYLVLSDLAALVSATPEPGRMEGDTLFWNFSALAPGASRSVELMMTIAGVAFIGSTLEIATGVIPYDGAGQALSAEAFHFYSVINCAYDPNDKQVYPNRSEQPPFMDNYTLLDETLMYTLRFQNTGNDTAFNIVLRDQLSDQLDWTTFRPGSSSHPYEATLHDGGLLEFHFRNILLPDSTVNEPGSHGFVQFEIASLPNLEEGAAIDNAAGIYFDFNPPIVTNTVNSIMVEMLPNFTPAAAFNYTGIGLEASFFDASTNDPESWLWEFGDGNSSPAQDPVHTYEEAGAYTVCLTAANAWGSTQYCEEITISLTSATGVADAASIQLHPNPANTTVWVDCSNLPLPQQLVLYSAAGKPLQSITLQKRQAAWDISALAAGSYWVRTEDGVVLPLVVVK